jgi:hypothetical protein
VDQLARRRCVCGCTDALNNPDYRDAVDKLIHTTDGAAYATDPDYISKVVSIIEQYGLTEYDVRESGEDTKKSVDEIADEVIDGKWGNGTERKQRLEAAGYDYSEVQSLVNRKCGVSTAKTDTKSVEELANEVIAGKWGNGTERKPVRAFFFGRGQVWTEWKKNGWKPRNCLTLRGFRVIYRLPKKERSTYYYGYCRKGKQGSFLLPGKPS